MDNWLGQRDWRRRITGGPSYELNTHFLGLTQSCYCRHLYHTPGLTFSLDSNSIPTNNISRINVYDLDANGTLDGSLRAESELPAADVPFSNGWIVGDGSSPISCCRETPGFIPLNALEPVRGWDVQRKAEGGRRVHYLRRLEQTPEEGYYSCHISGTNSTQDTNSPVGVYILYPSESPHFMIIVGVMFSHIPLLQSLQ